MDTLTHALSGALLARATEPNQHPGNADQLLPRRLRMWVGFWTAAFPDSDFVLRFADPLTYLTAHRGVTHSVLMLPLWAAGLALLLTYVMRKRHSWKAFVGVCALGIGIHILGDVITAFGTMILAPFSNWRLQFPTTFIIDPAFTGIIVAGLLASAYWSRTRLAAVLGLTALVGLVAFQGVQRGRAVEIGRDYIAERKIDVARAHAIPQPLSPFNWMVVVEEPLWYHLAYANLWRRQALNPGPDASWFGQLDASYRPVSDLHWQKMSRYGETEATLAETVWDSDIMARYRSFALFPALYRIDRAAGRTCVWFHDLRFATVGRVNPFLYGGCRESDNAPWKIYRLLNGDDGTEILDLIPE